MSSDWAETAAMAIAKTVAKMVAFMTAVCGKIGGDWWGLVGIVYFARNRRYEKEEEEGAEY